MDYGKHATGRNEVSLEFLAKAIAAPGPGWRVAWKYKPLRVFYEWRGENAAPPAKVVYDTIVIHNRLAERLLKLSDIARQQPRRKPTLKPFFDACDAISLSHSFIKSDFYYRQWEQWLTDVKLQKASKALVKAMHALENDPPALRGGDRLDGINNLDFRLWETDFEIDYVDTGNSYQINLPSDGAKHEGDQR
jgi:hypothetical protein